MHRIRRIILRTCRITCVLLLLCCCLPSVSAGADNTGMLTDAVTKAGALYNGIVIPDDWDYTVSKNDPTRKTVPYLLSAADGGYAPELINADTGRQLFVDDFLIESTNLRRAYYQAQITEEPVFVAETEWEMKSNPGVAMTSGGLWYDMDEKVYKMWYGAGFCNHLAYATSTDGIHWTRPALLQSGCNEIVRNQQQCSSSVWIDYNAPAEERYKLMIRSGDSVAGKDATGVLYTSANGTAWRRVGETGILHDRSTFFYNELLDRWVFSIRYNTEVCSKTTWARTRAYHAGDTWLEAATWTGLETGDNPATFWMMTDADDTVDPTQNFDLPQLYNFDAIAYESITLGMYQIWYGPNNNIIDQTGNPKITELQAAFSRDGYYFDRPLRGAGNALIPASRTEGTWNYGYEQSATGGLIVYDDEIRIYFSAFSGEFTDETGKVISGAHYGGAVGYATLRRDGFASMNGTGELLTKPLTVTKPVKYLYVNTDASGGALRAEILDADGRVLEGFSAADCVAVTADDCCTRFGWKNGKDLSFLSGKEFRIRFVSDNAELYSFWLSNDEKGTSGGAMGAGYAGSKLNEPDKTDTDTTESVPKQGKGCKSSAGTALPVLLLSATVLFTGRKRRATKINTKRMGMDNEGTV